MAGGERIPGAENRPDIDGVKRLFRLANVENRPGGWLSAYALRGLAMSHEVEGLHEKISHLVDFSALETAFITELTQELAMFHIHVPLSDRVLSGEMALRERLRPFNSEIRILLEAAEAQQTGRPLDEDSSR